MNMLGIREKEKYGNLTLESIYDDIRNLAVTLDVEVDFFQSNIEGEIINSIHKAYEIFDGIVINPAAFTHYSIAILDALNAVSIPTVEVHMTNIFSREEFRKKTVTGAGCIGIISGFGREVYPLALRGLHQYLNSMR